MASTPSVILLPVDGSPSSTRAARHAAVLAKALGSSVLVLNVQPEIEEWQTHGIGRQAAIEHHAKLAKAASVDASRVLAEAGISFDSIVEHGETPQVIARVAAERNCASVVMGTRGQGELKGILMGSVGLKLIHLLEVPLTFVH
jgi:nucleotide-binding universal stress UspA family protein